MTEMLECCNACRVCLEQQYLDVRAVNASYMIHYSVLCCLWKEIWLLPPLPLTRRGNVLISRRVESVLIDIHSLEPSGGSPETAE
jgi:hypothetical protein